MGWSDHHHILARDNTLGIQLETITLKNKNGEFLKPKHYYFIDGVKKQFLELDDLITAYNDKFQFEEENPDHEVKWIKVITKRKK